LSKISLLACEILAGQQNTQALWGKSFNGAQN